MSATEKRKWWQYLWPSSLTGQIVLLIVFTILAAQTINIFLVAHERAEAFRSGAVGPLTDQSIIAAELLEDTDDVTRTRLLRVLSGRDQRTTIDARPLANNKNASILAARLARQLTRRSGRQARVEARFIKRRFDRDDDDDDDRRRPRYRQRDRLERMGRPARALRPFRVDRLLVSLKLKDGNWLNILWRLPSRDLDWLKTTMFSNIVLAVFLSLLAILFLRRVTRPVKNLASAAEALGRGEDVPALKEEGPREIRRATAAFNAMQDRLSRFIKDRTQMLAAISHDLRTPITSLKLRAELLDDEPTRDNMMRILDEMQAMTESVLSFARDDANNEAIESIDIRQLLHECADAHIGNEEKVRFEMGDAPIMVRGRPLSLKRAFGNLLENALVYGQHATISVADNAESYLISIRDKGPGIPNHQQEDMFKPFTRLENSRNRDTGGTGLGLAIARSVIRGHGGDISLQNGAGGGLIATVSLPKSV